MNWTLIMKQTDECEPQRSTISVGGIPRSVSDGKFTIIRCPCPELPIHYRVWEPTPVNTWKNWTVTGPWEYCINHVLNKIRTSNKEIQEIIRLRYQDAGNS